MDTSIMSIILLLLGLSLAWLSTIHRIWIRGFLRNFIWLISFTCVLACAMFYFPWLLMDAGSLRASLIGVLCAVLPMSVVFLTALFKHLSRRPLNHDRTSFDSTSMPPPSNL
jgi:hypothetical protein